LRKYPEVQLLSDYSSKPPIDFWKNIHFNPLPVRPHTKINIVNFEELITEHSHHLTISQIARARTVIKNLKEGAPSFQKNNLPPCNEKNASSAFVHGAIVTDNLIGWLKAGYVSGPFDFPPTDKFRINCLMAVPQESKVQTVLNVSVPINNSFNSNIEIELLEKVTMSSAKKFSYTLKKCGFDAKISKFDMCDAYKQIPCPISDLRLQGFGWLNKMFVETTQIFGAKSAVCNFDQLGNTLCKLATVASGIDPCLVHRHLDDVPIVGRKNDVSCETFSKTDQTLYHEDFQKLKQTKSLRKFQTQTQNNL
jgi:hypothetical protein